MLFALTIAAVGYALIICTVVQTHDRYAYVMEFEYYLPLALSPFLFIAPGRKGALGSGTQTPAALATPGDDSATLGMELRGSSPWRLGDLIERDAKRYNQHNGPSEGHGPS